MAGITWSAIPGKNRGLREADEEDKGTRRQGDKETADSEYDDRLMLRPIHLFPVPLVSLSPCLHPLSSSSSLSFILISVFNHHFNPTIHLAAGGGVIGSDWFALAKALDSFDLFGLDA